MEGNKRYNNYDCFQKEMYQLLQIATMNTFENSKIEDFQRDAVKEIYKQLDGVNPDCVVMILKDLYLRKA